MANLEGEASNPKAAEVIVGWLKQFHTENPGESFFIKDISKVTGLNPNTVRNVLETTIYGWDPVEGEEGKKVKRGEMLIFDDDIQIMRPGSPRPASKDTGLGSGVRGKHAGKPWVPDYKRYS